MHNIEDIEFFQREAMSDFNKVPDWISLSDIKFDFESKNSVELIADYWSICLQRYVDANLNFDITPILQDIFDLSLKSKSEYPIYITDGWINEIAKVSDINRINSLLADYVERKGSNNFRNAVLFVSKSLKN